MVVKQIDGDWLMLLSYWDGGWVILNVNDPANPVYVADFEYPAVDLELLQQFGVSLTPEGNAHQAEWTIDNRFIIGMDEFEITPPHVGVYPSLAYISYYAGGLRAIQIQCANPADTGTCELLEVSDYLDPAGNNFWGVETFISKDGFTYILALGNAQGVLY